jgi:predicted protein tyrosine phosphatase
MIYVCSLQEMPEHARALRPSHLVSVVAPEELPPTPPGIRADRHLRIGIHDISEPIDGQVLPEVDHVATLIEFIRAWRGEAPLLMHCVAGISRSMAAALIALSLKTDEGEVEAARRMRQIAPHARPNNRMVALADRVLGRDGRLVAAREAMGPAEPRSLGPLVRFPLPRAGPAPVRASRPLGHGPNGASPEAAPALEARGRHPRG